MITSMETSKIHHADSIPALHNLINEFSDNLIISNMAILERIEQFAVIGVRTRDSHKVWLAASLLARLEQINLINE